MKPSGRRWNVRRATSRIAALDVGTNSIHLVIASLDLAHGRIRPLHREKEIVRLGSGTPGGEFLSEEAMARGVTALKRFKRLADAAGASVRAIATSAVREATNKDEFLRRVRTRCGISLHIASGPEEARLTYYGVLQAFPAVRVPMLLVDVGGGSTEFLVGRGRQVRYTNSLKLGAVRLSERFFKGGRADADSVKACRQYLRGTLSPVIRQVRRHEFERIILTSGTALNLASMIRGQRTRESSKPLNGFTFQREELEDMALEIASARTARERARLPGLDPDRADIVLGGALILDEAMRGLRAVRMTVSTMALREGILADELHRRGRRGRGLPNSRGESVLHLARSFNQDHAHPRQVAQLSLQIFDGTKRLHRMGAVEREWLEAAALLHEIGIYLSREAHHKHSYYMIRNAELLGFTEDEKEIIANVARYHRKALPSTQHEAFRKLSAEEQAGVAGLAAILRIADGLDRSHSSAVKSVTCRALRSKLHLKLRKARGRSLELELWGARQKSDLFEETFGREVEITS